MRSADLISELVNGWEEKKLGWYFVLGTEHEWNIRERRTNIYKVRLWKVFIPCDKGTSTVKRSIQKERVGVDGERKYSDKSLRDW